MLARWVADHMEIARMLAILLLIPLTVGWIWTTIATVRRRWHEPHGDSDFLPLSFRWNTMLLAFIGGACGLGAFVCVMFLCGKLVPR